MSGYTGTATGAEIDAVIDRIVDGFQVKETIYIDDPRVIDGGTPPAASAKISSGNGAVMARKFDGAAQDEDVLIPWKVPDDILVASGIKFDVETVITEGTAPSTEGVVFELSGYSIGHGDSINGSFGTAQTSKKTGMSDAQYDRVKTEQSSQITVTDLAQGELAMLKLMRDYNHADDDYAQDIGVVAINIYYTRVLEDPA